MSNMATLRTLTSLLMIFRLVAANPPFDHYVYYNGRSSRNLTVAINVPQNATDELFFHFQAPISQQWSAFGFGNQMAGALMFVVYGNKDGENITVSPRLATGHSLPQYTSDVAVTILPGTDIVDGNYMVNAKCSGCRKWNGGQIDVNSTTQSMIWAVGPTESSFVSDDLNYKISQHSSNAMMTFSLSMQKATGEAGVPNVLNVPMTNNGNNGTTPSRFPIAFHAFLLIVTFLIIFPGGYLLLRLFERVWLHMVVQTIGLALVVAGVVTGIAVSQTRQISPKLNTPHQIIGLLVLLLTLTAWTIGLTGHRIYKKTGQQKLPTKLHRGAGPLAVLFGLINVGLGFNFAGNTKRVIPFYIVTLIVFTLIGGFVFMINRRKMKRQAMNTPAAQNFNEALQSNGGGPPGFGSNEARSEHVPMQTFPPAIAQPQSVYHTGSKLQ